MVHQKKSVHIPESCAHQIKRAVLRPESLCIYACILRLVSLDAKGQCTCIVNVITLNIVNIITSLCRLNSDEKETGDKLHGKGKRGSLSQGNILLIFLKV
jgi:hypothetical protein